MVPAQVKDRLANAVRSLEAVTQVTSMTTQASQETCVVPPRLVTPMQRELGAGLRQTLETLVGGRLMGAWERAKLPI